MTKFGNPTSVSALLRDESERRLYALFDDIRTLDIGRAEARELLHGMCRSKGWWIQTFASGPKKRPPHDVEKARRQLAVLLRLEEWMLQKEAGHAADPGG
ncbi:hypothetical protein [Shinella pollutisoli]|uniref:Uncharacterized protein n=1 Tax=Shinella pollutisoli TaxID=2250594 RepID=A0ABV7DJ18_9HYPH|nr:hypothetical protein [Shinella pollutisoli]